MRGVLWCAQLRKKILGVPLESGLCVCVCSQKIKTMRGLHHAAVETSRSGVLLLVRGPHGSASYPSIRALGFQVSIQSGSMRCLFLSKWVQIFVSLYWWCDCFWENPLLVCQTGNRICLSKGPCCSLKFVCVVGALSCVLSGVPSSLGFFFLRYGWTSSKIWWCVLFFSSKNSVCVVLSLCYCRGASQSGACSRYQWDCVLWIFGAPPGGAGCCSLFLNAFVEIPSEILRLLFWKVHQESCMWTFLADFLQLSQSIDAFKRHSSFHPDFSFQKKNR